MIFLFAACIAAPAPHGHEGGDEDQSDSSTENGTGSDIDCADAENTYCTWAQDMLAKGREMWRPDAELFVVTDRGGWALDDQGQVVGEEGVEAFLNVPGEGSWAEISFWRDSWNIDVRDNIDWDLTIKPSDLELHDWTLDSPAAISATGKSGGRGFSAAVIPAAEWREEPEGCLNPALGCADPGWADDHAVWCISWEDADYAGGQDFTIDGETGEVVCSEDW